VNLEITTKDLPRYIAIEGPIGVGKTSFSRRLAETLNYETTLEAPEENPFLPRFYKSRREVALQTQLFFLFERVRQLEEARQADMFLPVRIADFLLEKDRLFAEINLDSDEMKLYDTIYAHLTINAPTPDLVIYLQAPVPVLLARIQSRGIDYERTIDKAYLTALTESYARFFHYYDRAPLLIVNTTDIDLVHSDRDYEELVRFLLQVKRGRHYFNPQPTMI
jgi:deoxyguanosine kinase